MGNTGFAPGGDSTQHSEVTTDARQSPVESPDPFAKLAFSHRGADPSSQVKAAVNGEGPDGSLAVEARTESESGVNPQGDSWFPIRMGFKLVDLLGADPNVRTGAVRLLGRIGIDFVPVIGPLKKIADARALWKVGETEAAEELAVIGTVELGLDVGLGIATSGLSALIPDEFFTALRTAKDTQRRVSSSRFLKFLPDPVGLAAKVVLKAPPVKGVARSILRA